MPTKTTTSPKKTRTSSSIPISPSFSSFSLFLTCRDETKRQKGRSGNVHLYFTRAGRLIETVSSKALSRFPRFHVSTIRKCYQLLGTPESPRLIPVGDTSSPFPCEYIKIPAYTTSPRLTPVPFRSRGHGPSRITFLRPRSSAF